MNDQELFNRILKAKESTDKTVRDKADSDYMELYFRVGRKGINDLWEKCK